MGKGWNKDVRQGVLRMEGQCMACWHPCPGGYHPNFRCTRTVLEEGGGKRRLVVLEVDANVMQHGWL